MNTIFSYLTYVLGFDSNHPLLFTQVYFWIFFLLVYAVFFYIATRHWRLTVRNAYLFAVSIFFYYKTSGIFVLLLVCSTLLGWTLGIGMDSSTSPTRRKIMMAAGVTVNLLTLGFFKYAYFFTDIFNETFGTDYCIALKILLPVGISFYTFQNISYIVDVYKQRIAHVGNVFDFGFYTSFFPQLVAGPILRADQFVPQLYKPFHLTRRQFGLAVFWILNGLIKKIVLSDYLAVNFVDRVFDNPLLYTPFENFSALMVYSLQVYADFSGYTDIAIGVAMLMGFHLPTNFNSPYKAQNPTDFWRRWHISLSHWLREYLYIPLGGNRSAGWASYSLLTIILAIAAFRLHHWWFTLTIIAVLLSLALCYLLRPNLRHEMGTNVNNMDTMLLGGLWHGASFNFITWGGLNGLGILVYKWWHKHSWKTRLTTLTIITAFLWILKFTTHYPLANMLSFISLVCLIGYMVQAYNTKHITLNTIWNTGLTFVFISFTRLFFRSGSNLDPAEANKVAWLTARQMVNQIGSRWNIAQIPEIIGQYWPIFLLFVIGMAIHWLPARFKRRYRLWFAQMPLWGLVLAIIATIYILRQFITAELQPFIYFQF